MLTAYCGDQTQLSSGSPLILRYLPFTTSFFHCTREKFTRHCAPSRGGNGTFPVLPSTFQGKAMVTVQPLSVSPGSFSVPRTWTAFFRPGISQELYALPPSLYGLSRNRSQSVPKALISYSM